MALTESDPVPASGSASAPAASSGSIISGGCQVKDGTPLMGTNTLVLDGSPAWKCGGAVGECLLCHGHSGMVGYQQSSCCTLNIRGLAGTKTATAVSLESKLYAQQNCVTVTVATSGDAGQATCPGAQLAVGCGCQTTGTATSAFPAAASFSESRPVGLSTCRWRYAIFPTISSNTFQVTIHHDALANRRGL
jgi:hypothetical protein